MPPIVEQRVINVTTARDDDDLSRRKHLCSVFRYRLKKAHLSARSFSKLSRVSEDTVYSWTSKSARCVPPPPIALLLLSLIERDRSMIPLIESLEESSP